MIKINRLLAVLCALMFSVLHGQAQYHDFGTWSSIKLEQNMKGPYELSFEPQWRTDQGMSRSSDYIFDFGGDWKVKKWLKVGATLRVGWQQQEDGFFRFRQRMAFDLKLDEGWRDWKFDFRVRYQSGRVASTESLVDFRRAFRSKFSVSRDLTKKWSTSAAFEAFISTGEGVNELTDTRYKLELERKIKKRRYISLGYQFQNELNTAYPIFEHVLLLSFKMGFK